MNWIDITYPIFNNMVHWPGDVPVQVKHSAAIAWNDEANVTMVSMSVHTSTHMDAPLHFIQGGKSIADIDFSRLIGKCRIIGIKDVDAITVSEIKQYEINKGDRVLFKTDNSKSDWTKEIFKEKYVYLDIQAAKYLAEKEVQLVGIDYLSVGYGKDQPEVHKALLGNEIAVIEGLDLRNVGHGEYEMICLPLKIEGSDGSPVRVLVKRL